MILYFVLHFLLIYCILIVLMLWVFLLVVLLHVLSNFSNIHQMDWCWIVLLLFFLCFFKFEGFLRNYWGVNAHHQVLLLLHPDKSESESYMDWPWQIIQRKFFVIFNSKFLSWAKEKLKLNIIKTVIKYLMYFINFFFNIS